MQLAFDGSMQSGGISKGLLICNSLNLLPTNAGMQLDIFSYEVPQDSSRQESTHENSPTSIAYSGAAGSAIW